MQSTAVEKLDFKKILPVFIIVFIDLLGVTIIIPLLPLYAASYGANAFMVGLLGAAYPAMQFIGAPLLGRLSDRFGRKPVLVLSQMGTLIGFLVLGFARSLPLLFLARIIDGFSGANISTAQAVISDSTTEKTRTQGLGLIGAAFGLGFVIGPVIAFISLAASGNNFHIPAFIAAGFSLISILLTWFLLEETLPAERRGANLKETSFSFGNMFQALRLPLVGLLLVLMFFQQVAFGAFQQIFSLFTLSRLGLDAAGNSVIFIFVGIVVVFTQGFLVGKLSRRFGERLMVRGGLVLMAAGLLLTGLTPRQTVPWYDRAQVQQEMTSSAEPRQLTGETPPTQSVFIPLPEDTHKGWLGLGWILLAMIPAAMGGGMLQPTINSLLTRSVSPLQVGGILGISAALLSGANALAPVLGGAAFEVIGPSAPYLLGGALMAVLWVFSARVK